MAVIKDKKCMIIGAAPLASGAVFEEFDPKEHYVICADAGYDTAVQYGVRPDLVIGDFDSAAKRPPETIRTIKLPVEKDVTDMMGAVMVGIALYGMAGFLRETGLYDVTRGWSKPAAAPGLTALSGPPTPGAPFAAPGSEPARSLRDQPPRLRQLGNWDQYFGAAAVCPGVSANSIGLGAADQGD